jgi:hypothetical protein
VEWPERSRRDGSPPGEPVELQDLSVQQDSCFVVGDNLNYSLDSRAQGYGRVKQGQAQGKGLYIYGSPGKPRFGCGAESGLACGSGRVSL